jgi:putative chitinase
MPDGSTLPPLCLSRAVLLAAAPHCADPDAWLAPLQVACSRFRVTTPLRVAAFLAQVGHESADLGQLSETLNYTPDGLVKTFPTRVPAWLADRIGRKPGRPADQVAIAEAVYGRRMGNHFTGDAWRFRGAGLLQITGFAGHDAVAQAFDMATDDVPDWLRTREGAATSAAWWFDTHGCNELADAGAINTISRTVNGGGNGLEDRRSRFLAACKVLGL